MARENAEQWAEEADNDMEMAKILLQNGKYNGAVFHAQQAAEKILKAMLYFNDNQPWGHSILLLMQKLEEFNHIFTDEMKKIARELDRHYTASRSPDVLPSISPKDAYDEETAQDVIEKAETILNFGKQVLFREG